MEAFAALADKVMTFLAAVALPIGGIVVAFNTVKALIGGGLDRAVRTLVVQTLIVGLLVASLQNPAQSRELLGLVGGGLWMALYETLRSAF